MPNYVKNRIELIGSEEQVNKVVERFSTFYEKTPCKSYDGDTTYKNITTDEYGWLNEKTKEFTRREQPTVDFIPEGFEIHYEDEFTRFPDFNKIVPMPESLNITSGSLGELGHQLLFGLEKYIHLDINKLQERFSKLSIEQQREAVELGIIYNDNIKKYGHSTWYDWSVENWGTKWNASFCKKISNNVYTFDTAWSGIPKLIDIMSKEFPEVKFLYEYSDEDTGSNCGVGLYLNGEIDFNKLKSQSPEAYELYFKLRPEDLNYYIKLEDGTYEFSDEKYDEYKNREISIPTIEEFNENK